MVKSHRNRSSTEEVRRSYKRFKALESELNHEKECLKAQMASIKIAESMDDEDERNKFCSITDEVINDYRFNSNHKRVVKRLNEIYKDMVEKGIIEL